MIDKNTIKLAERIKKLEAGNFSEDDIELLLIQIRESAREKSILREICNFIAHKERSVGICHKRIDSRYAKIIRIDLGVEKHITEEFVSANKNEPWSFFSDKILSDFDEKRIEKKIFELLIKNGIDEIKGEHLKKYYGINKKQVNNLITINYSLIDGFYVLNKSISSSDYKLLKDILKFIRGTITGASVFSDYEIGNELLSSIKSICKEKK